MDTVFCNANPSNQTLSIIALCVSVISMFVSAIVYLIVNIHSQRIELKKIGYEFIKELNSMRLNAYLEIYKTVSGFIKKIKRTKISYKELNDFYEEYSCLDSKSSLLFDLCTVDSSAELMRKIGNMLTNHTSSDIIGDDVKRELIPLLGKIELSLKYELGAFENKGPLTVENSKLAKIYEETLGVSRSVEQAIRGYPNYKGPFLDATGFLQN